MEKEESEEGVLEMGGGGIGGGEGNWRGGGIGGFARGRE
jgi:hypothetical protein